AERARHGLGRDDVDGQSSGATGADDRVDGDGARRRDHGRPREGDRRGGPAIERAGALRLETGSMAIKDAPERLTIGDHEVTISNPGKVLFPKPGHTKLDLVRYYLAVAEGALRAAGGRPNVLVRYPNGIGGEFFYQKRAPESRPPWIDVISLSFPSG